MAKWLKDPQTVTLEERDGVGYITLNRPERRNALSGQLLQELHAALQEADDLKAVRCVVIQGAGKDFSAGADIGGASADPDFDPADYRDSDSLEDDIWKTTRRSESRLQIFRMHKPVIAKVHGNCLAAATDVALNCDIIIAAREARIGFPATRALGSPANHMWLYHVGPQWAKRMLFTGDTISGRDAQRIGLVLKAVPADRLDDEVHELARRIALVDPALTAAHKRIVNAGLELMGWSHLQRMAAENDARAHRSPSLGAFMETAKTRGLKEALRDRDAPFGTGEVTLDDD